MTVWPTSASERLARNSRTAVDHARTDASRDREERDVSSLRARAERRLTVGGQVGVIGDVNRESESSRQLVAGECFGPLRREVRRPQEPACAVIDAAGQPHHGMSHRAMAVLGTDAPNEVDQCGGHVGLARCGRRFPQQHRARGVVTKASS